MVPNPLKKFFTFFHCVGVIVCNRYLISELECKITPPPELNKFSSAHFSPEQISGSGSPWRGHGPYKLLCIVNK